MKPDRDKMQNIQDLFVDRADELERFRLNRGPGTDAPAVYCFTGESQIGKTWLIYRLYMDLLDALEGGEGARSAEPLAVMYDFYSAPNPSYIEILQQMLEGLDPVGFRTFLKRTKDLLKVPIKIEVDTGDASGGTVFELGENAQIEGSSFDGQFAAGSIINIKNVNVVVEDNPASLKSDVLIRQVTEAFINDLVAYVGERDILFFFDDMGEKTLDKRTRRWLIEDFVRPLCAGRLPRARFVLILDEALEADLIECLYPRIRTYKLHEFPGGQINEIYREYLVEKIDVPEEQITEATLFFFHDKVQGRPNLMFPVALSLKQRLDEIGGRSG